MIYFDFATGFNLPPYWINHPVNVQKEGEAKKEFAPVAFVPNSNLNHLSDTLIDHDVPYLGNFYQDKMMLKHEDETSWWSPLRDPVISVTGKNIVARRNVAKAEAVGERRGSVKELWSVDDYEINIAGTFTNMVGGDVPEEDLKKLRIYCESKKTLLIESRLLSIFGIRRIVVVDYTLPFTKGIENQMYTIKAYSDDMFDLLIE
ncbi:MAG: DUF6046 domain-containing protein [Prevotellaceae bacterium]|jgi:hypothetical protein|nr:DUF6046 domain-containing protein [Prevotellaceae bacterium]